MTANVNYAQLQKMFFFDLVEQNINSHNILLDDNEQGVLTNIEKNRVSTTPEINVTANTEAKSVNQAKVSTKQKQKIKGKNETKSKCKYDENENKSLKYFKKLTKNGKTEYKCNGCSKIYTNMASASGHYISKQHNKISMQF